MNTPRKPSRPMPIDPLLQQRLAQLGERRTSPPLPPPTIADPTVRQADAAPTAGVSAATNARLAALAARGSGRPGSGTPGGGKPGGGKPAGRRVKPARASKLAALGLSAITTLGLAGMFAAQDGSTDSVQLTSGTGDPLIVAPATSTTAATTTTPTTADAAAPTTADATASTVAATTAETVVTTAAVPAGVADGTYVGAADSNRWGTVQVQAVYSGGQLVDVQILQYPNGDSKSVRINQRALPTLISEAISIQSADVNTVSGATYTTDSYRISLQSAIDAANATAGVTG